MPKFKLTSPEGKTFEVTAPEGTTPEQAYTMFQKQQGDAVQEASRSGNIFDTINRGIYEGGGLVADKASQLGASPDVAGGLGATANVISNLIPVEGVAGAARLATTPLKGALRGTADWLMNSALKPTIDAHKSGDAALAVKTMLDDGYNATKGGVLAMGDKITDLNNQVKSIISGSNATINKADVYSRLNGVLDRFKNQVNPKADVAAIQNVGDEFLSHPELTGKTDFPIQLAQDLKQGTQRKLKDSYGELSGAAEEAQKALGRGLREDIATAEPAAADALAKERDLIRTLNVTERRALMDLNKNPAGLSLLATNPIAAASFMADKSALFKSIFARMINPTTGAVPATAGRLATGAALNQGHLQPDPSY